jgi:hypothetical protein
MLVLLFLKLKVEEPFYVFLISNIVMTILLNIWVLFIYLVDKNDKAILKQMKKE